MFRRWRYHKAIVGFLILSGCAATPSVFTDFDRAQSFDNYRTFAWINDDPMTVVGDRGPNPLVAQRIAAAIRETLASKGYRFVTKREQADFAVSFTVGARDQLEIREREVVDFYGPHWRWGYDYFGVVRPPSFPRTEVTTRQYVEGSLAIDIFDVQRKSPVWHGNASKRLTRAEREGTDSGDIGAAVATILAGFPPQ